MAYNRRRSHRKDGHRHPVGNPTQPGDPLRRAGKSGRRTSRDQHSRSTGSGGDGSCQPSSAPSLFIGIGIGASGDGGSAGDSPLAEPAPAETVTIDPSEEVRAELEARAAQLDERQAQLDERQAQLDQRESALAAQKADVEAGKIPGSGIYLVGSDIQPGTYRSSTQGSCYWARLSGTSGEFGDIIANDNVTGQAIVTIQPSDVAFESNDCGEWQLQ